MSIKLSKDALKEFAKKHNISIENDTKEHLLTKIKKHFPTLQQTKEFIKYFFSQDQSEEKKMKKILLPIKKTYRIQSYPHITLLPQSDSHIMIVWNISSDDELPMKAWQIKDELGLDIYLPSTSRSIILPKAMIPSLRFQLYIVYENDKRLYAEYDGSTNNPLLFQCDNHQTFTHRVSNSSHNHFRRQASENHWRK
ncbi:MAG: hypothetical protein ACRCV0_02750 [Brevinema sp.]